MRETYRRLLWITAIGSATFPAMAQSPSPHPRRPPAGPALEPDLTHDPAPQPPPPHRVSPNTPPIIQPGLDDGTQGWRPKVADTSMQSSNVIELPDTTYVFIGARYRGNPIPAFLLNAFVSGATRTLYSNTAGLEVDIRRNGFSIVPAVSYSEYTSGAVLFADKGSDQSQPGNWNVFNSNLKAIYATVDFLWSTKVHRNLDIEYGLGLGIGVLFGNLQLNWVWQNPNGDLTNSAGTHYSACATQTSGVGCAPSDHTNDGYPPKVGNYVEPSWANGGYRPNIYPWITPQFGLRYKPVKEFQARLGVGFSMTGFWFGLSADYGLEKKPKPHDK